jgi:hypothetical protein
MAVFMVTASRISPYQYYIRHLSQGAAQSMRKFQKIPSQFSLTEKAFFSRLVDIFHRILQGDDMI